MEPVYKDGLNEEVAKKFLSTQKEDPFKTVSLPSKAFERYDGLNVLASDL